MARQVPSRNSFLLVVLLVILLSCHTQHTGTLPIPNVAVSANVPGWQQREGKLWLNGRLFSGLHYQCTATGDTLFAGTYLDGKSEGIHRQWYATGRLKEIRQYRNSWQEGEQRGWHESGKPAFVYQFKNDVYEGSRKEWYTNGKPALTGNYHNGQEQGLQRQWFDSGRLKVNYEARNGRNYGFTGVKNCVNVWDSIAVPH